MSFAAFAGHKYLNLETFKKNGEGVRTPVWFAAYPSASLDSREARLYVYSVSDSGKVKRIRNNNGVRIAPCNASGKLLSEWVDGRAEIVTGAEAMAAMRLLGRKYFPWRQILAFFAKFSRKGRTVFVIWPE